MGESLPFDGSKFVENVELEDHIKTPDVSIFGNFVERGLNYPDYLKQKTKFFPFCPETKISPQDVFSNYMIDNEPKNYTQNRKLVCD